jgi:outer membrane protein assembly factor BamA
MFQKNRLLFPALLLGILCLFPLAAQENVITSIEIIGLKRTKPHIARYPLETFLGRDVASLDLNEVEAAVRDTGILEPSLVELAAGEDGTVLRVTVEEKWSILPFPMASFGSGGTSFGLFLLDTNAFGLRDQMAVGGMYGSAGWMAAAMYNNTPDRTGRPGWNTAFMYNRQEKEDMDRDEKVLRRYTADTLYLSLGLYYPFTGHFTGSAGISFSNVSPKNNSSAFNNPDEEARLLGFSPGIALRYSNWDGYLLSEQSLSLKYTYALGISGSSFHIVELQAAYEKSLVPGFRLNLNTGAVWKPGAGPLFEDGPRQAKVDILPGQFSALHYMGFSAGLEKYLVKIRFGTLTVLAAWQGVFSQGPLSGYEFDHGPSGGVRFYLSRLAIPALGAGIAYNMNSGLSQFTFSLGMSF